MKSTGTSFVTRHHLLIAICVSFPMAGCVLDDAAMENGGDGVVGVVIEDQAAGHGSYEADGIALSAAGRAEVEVEAGFLPEEAIDGEAMADEDYSVAAGCSGTRIEHIPVKYGSSTYGYLDVYYNSATGKNCAMTRTTGAAYGNASYIDVYLARCTQTSSGSTCTVDSSVTDSGAFRYYAGPVSLSAANRCIFADGFIIYNGKAAYARTYPAASHCGS